jgi:hypothetical protein
MARSHFGVSRSRGTLVNGIAMRAEVCDAAV